MNNSDHSNACSLVYIASFNQRLNPGLKLKISRQVVSFRNHLPVSHVIVSDTNFHFFLRVFSVLFSTNSTVIYYRFSIFTLFFLLPALFFARFFKSSFIIVELPTPFSLAFRELQNKPTSLFLIPLMAISIFPLFVANKIVQRGSEGFSLFNLLFKDKSVIVPNSYDYSSVNQNFLRKHPYKVFSPLRIQLIIVANVQSWHGLDILLEALLLYRKYQSGNKVPVISCTLVSPSSQYLDSLLSEYLMLLQDNLFTWIDGVNISLDDLSQIYRTSDVAISSLGLSRLGLGFCSVLKTREYFAHSLPVIGSSNDFVFTKKTSYYYAIDEPLSPEKLFSCFQQLPLWLKETPVNIRDITRPYCDSTYEAYAILKDVLIASDSK